MSTFDADGHRLTEVEPDVWALADTGDESVPARVLANRSLLAQISTDNTLTQLRNVAGMPGAVAPALCMPDGHQGYGFPSAASPPSTPRTAASRRAASASTSTAASAC